MTNKHRLGFGAWQIGGSLLVNGSNQGWTDIEENEAISLVKNAYRLGFRFFDTADAYGAGKSEFILGKALKQKENIEFCTKFGNTPEHSQDFSAAYAEQALYQSLERLQVSKIQHYLLHNPPLDALNKDLLTKLNQLKEQGLIENIGISVPFVEPYLSFVPFFDSFEILYNPITTQNRAFLPQLDKKHVFLRSIFASGLLLKQNDFFLKDKPLNDFRAGLPDIVFEKAQAFVNENHILSDRIIKTIHETLSLNTSQVIIGFKNVDQLSFINSLI